MSTVEMLRKAAKLMRERAELATPGPWIHRIVTFANPQHGDDYVELYGDISSDGRSRTIVAKIDDYQDNEESVGYDAEHIVSWHPLVVLHIADFLETVAAWQDEGLGTCHEIESTNYLDAVADVLANAICVARSYLGEQP